MSSIEHLEVAGDVEEVRELVRVVVLDDVIDHPNADALELAIVGGWQCCVKLGEFKKGDLAVYCEIDAMLPISNPMFAFLEERKESLKLVGELSYSRIKTIRLRKELSQGLVIPVPADMTVKAGDNLTTQLGVLKYAGKAESVGQSADYGVSWYGQVCEFIAGGPLPKLQLPWPSFLKKSDQPRVQNVAASYKAAVENEEEFEVSFKLDGASTTAWVHIDYNSLQDAGGLRDVVFGLGSRNNELITKDILWSPVEQFRRWLAALLMMNRRLFKIWRFIVPRWKKGLMASEDQYVAASEKLRLKWKLKQHYERTGQAVAIQGELCGPGIQNNFEGLDEHKLFVYSVFIQDGNVFKELLPPDALEIVDALGLDYVPVHAISTTLPQTIKECLAYADGPAAFKKGGYREGFVFKSRRRNYSFKAISNKYLLKVGD